MAYTNKEIRNPLSGQSIRFLQTSADTEGEWLEMESSFAPGSTEPPAHYHPQQEEFFTVLTGRIMVRMEGRTECLRAGQRLVVLPNTVHAMWNPYDEKAVVNWRVEPALDTEYFLETGMGLASQGRVNKNGYPSFLQSVLLLNRYRRVYRLGSPAYLLQRFCCTLLAPAARLAGYKAVYKEYID